MGVNLYQIHQFGEQVGEQLNYKLLFLLIFYLRVKDWKSLCRWFDSTSGHHKCNKINNLRVPSIFHKKKIGEQLVNR